MKIARFFAILCAAMAIGQLIEQYFWAIVVVIVVAVIIYFYPKYAHYELQKKSLETDIRGKENDILLKQMELKIKLLEMESKNNKRGAKTEQVELSNDLLRQKLGTYSDGKNVSGYDDQLNKLG
jgi:hypothetical protein